MDRRTRNLFALMLVVVIAITGGAALLLSDTSTLGPDRQPATDSIEGVIVGVDSAGLGDVRGFSLRQVGGEIVVFSLGELENPTEFPPGHLAEHQATAEQVRVWYRTDGSERFAVRLEDVGS